MRNDEPKSRPDLTSVHPHYTWEAAAGEDAAVPAVPVGGEAEVEHLRAEVKRLRVALEDVVALALSMGEARQRAIVMQRRAIAALSGLDVEPAHTPKRGGPAGSAG